VECPVAKLRAHYEPFAWWLTRERIGQDLRERYSVPQEATAALLTLAKKLNAAEVNQLPQETRHNWLWKLDSIEGDQLLRVCRKRLESRTRRD
jgi:hypothetical protein